MHLGIFEAEKLFKKQSKLTREQILEYQRHGILISERGIEVVRKIEYGSEVCRRLKGRMSDDGLCNIVEKIYPPLQDVELKLEWWNSEKN